MNATRHANANTAADSVPDGLDINPNGMNKPQIRLVLEKFAMLDRIDANPGGEYAIDPYFDFEVTTAFGTITPGTPNLPELPIGSTQQEIALSALAMSFIGNGHDASKSVTLLTTGMLELTLVDDVRKLTDVSSTQPTGLAWDEVTIKVRIGDWDENGGGAEGNK